jgi:hypothetical protein
MFKIKVNLVSRKTRENLEMNLIETPNLHNKQKAYISENSNKAQSQTTPL